MFWVRQMADDNLILKKLEEYPGSIGRPYGGKMSLCAVKQSRKRHKRLRTVPKKKG